MAGAVNLSIFFHYTVFLCYATRYIIGTYIARIGPRCVEYRPSCPVDGADIIRVERHGKFFDSGVVLGINAHKPFPAPAYADYFNVVQVSAFHNCFDCHVQSGDIAPSR